jgi:hypothetical protein
VKLATTILEASGSAEVERFVARSANALVYTTRPYLELVAWETGSTPAWVVVSDDAGLRAALPVLVKQGRFGPVVNSLAYYGSNGGVIAAPGDDEAVRAAFHGLDALCAQQGACSATVISNPLRGDDALYAAAFPHDERDDRIGQITEFPADRRPETLLATFEDPRPRNIRRAQRAGVRRYASRSAETLAFLHAVHDQNIRAVGGLPKRREFFEHLPRVLPEEAWRVYVAELEGTPVAALLLLYAGETVEYFTPCIVEEHRATQALSLLVFDAMCDAMAAGYARWNWGGTWRSQHGVYAFKKKWGTRDLPYQYFTRIYAKTVRAASRAELLAAYPGFYVLPFAALRESSPPQESP